MPPKRKAVGEAGVARAAQRRRLSFGSRSFRSITRPEPMTRMVTRSQRYCERSTQLAVSEPSLALHGPERPPSSSNSPSRTTSLDSTSGPDDSQTLVGSEDGTSDHDSSEDPKDTSSTSSHCTGSPGLASPHSSDSSDSPASVQVPAPSHTHDSWVDVHASREVVVAGIDPWDYALQYLKYANAFQVAEPFLGPWHKSPTGYGGLGVSACSWPREVVDDPKRPWFEAGSLCEEPEAL
ncbi:hypothetical protein NKR23_g8498 [Pleurostoma richardsiae]|uniref:Uncharacterized protein n=1 Tax=Pleurostoma richardsiae TaxID=41990 RepID=A0AA38RT05_9PEZI|nr:hypothetical protein NKR23_g8498 [Pleurostoma richardsiae]